MEKLIELKQTIIEEMEKICKKKRISKTSLKILNKSVENMSDLTPEQNEVIEKIKLLKDYNKLNDKDIELIREMEQQVKEVFMSNEEITKHLHDIINDMEYSTTVRDMLEDRNIIVNMDPHMLNKLLDVYTKELEIIRIKSEIKLMNIRKKLQ